MSSAPVSRTGATAVAGWVLLVLAVAWAGAIHHGVGPEPPGGAGQWWQPQGFLFTWGTLDGLLGQPDRATFVLMLPALALFMGVAVLTRSALAASLALACVGLVFLSCFYGLGGTRRQIWSFFGWRGSAVMALFSLAVAAALLSPWLARRWLERSWGLRVLLYLPLAFAVMVAIRDVTGTDPELPFAISPWPVVPMFGLEGAAAAIAGLFALLGLAAATVGLLVSGRVVPAVLCAALAVALPLAGFALDLRMGPGLLALLVAAAALQLWLAGRPRERDTESTWLSAARPLTLGAALVALPVLSGQLLVERDYDVTRNERARRIVDALASYHEREQAYPDSLSELLEEEDLTAVPEPSVGFGVAEDAEFTYQNFGTSYLLEFSAPRWVQCAYNPPYPEEEEDEGSFFAPASAEEAPQGSEDDGTAAGEDGDALAGTGSWSCPQKPPELW